MKTCKECGLGFYSNSDKKTLWLENNKHAHYHYWCYANYLEREHPDLVDVVQHHKNYARYMVGHY